MEVNPSETTHGRKTLTKDNDANANDATTSTKATMVKKKASPTATTSSSTMDAATSDHSRDVPSAASSKGREWTESETQLLLERVSRFGEQWEVIAALFDPKRTVLDCSQRYYGLNPECAPYRKKKKKKRKTEKSSNNQKKNKRANTSLANEIEFNPPTRRWRKTFAETERMFPCTEPNCSKAYGTDSALRTHKRIKHGIKSTSPPPISSHSSKHVQSAEAKVASPTSSPLVASSSPSLSAHSSASSPSPSLSPLPALISLTPPPRASTTASTTSTKRKSTTRSPTQTGLSSSTTTTSTSTTSTYQPATKPQTKHRSLLETIDAPKVVDDFSDQEETEGTAFGIEEIAAGGLEINDANGGYKMTLATRLTGALWLQIESQAEITRLIMPLSHTNIVARSLDECLLRPTPFQLQLVLSKTPEIQIKAKQQEDSTLAEPMRWRKLSIGEIPASSRLETLVRSPIYGVSMTFQNYASLLNLLVSDQSTGERFQLLPSSTPELYNRKVVTQLPSSTMSQELAQPSPLHLIPPPVPPLYPPTTFHPTPSALHLSPQMKPNPQQHSFDLLGSFPPLPPTLPFAAHQIAQSSAPSSLTPNRIFF